MPFPTSSDACKKCSGNWKNFLFLTENEMQLVNNNRYEASFRPGEIMIKQGSPATHALFIANGLAKVYMEGIKGKNFLLEIAKPGTIIMSPGAYINSRHTWTVAALTQAQACFVSIDILKKSVTSNGEFAKGLLADMSERALVTQRKMVSQAQKRMSGRLAEILLYFATDIFGKDEYEMILTRQELGEMAGMAKECVVRILGEFEDKGLIYSDSVRLKILDREQLAEIAEKG
ncbi:MAG: Crp/Fnr family transcriptional regulator [Chloroflexota bacterium]